MSKKTVTGRTQSEPELQAIKGTVANKQVEFYAAVTSGLFSAKVENPSNAGSSDLVSLDFATIEQRVAAMPAAFAAPYGQEGKTHD